MIFTYSRLYDVRQIASLLSWASPTMRSSVLGGMLRRARRVLAESVRAAAAPPPPPSFLAELQRAALQAQRVHAALALLGARRVGGCGEALISHDLTLGTSPQEPRLAAGPRRAPGSATDATRRLDWRRRAPAPARRAPQSLARLSSHPPGPSAPGACLPTRGRTVAQVRARAFDARAAPLCFTSNPFNPGPVPCLRTPSAPTSPAS